MILLHSVTAIKCYVITLICHVCSKETIMYSMHVVNISASDITYCKVTQLSYRYWSDPQYQVVKLVTTPLPSMDVWIMLIMLITNNISIMMFFQKHTNVQNSWHLLDSPSQSSFLSPYTQLPNTNTTATVEYKVTVFMVKF